MGMGDRLAKNSVIVLIGAFASLATILFFTTGQSLPELLVKWGFSRAKPAGRSTPATEPTTTSTWESAVLNAVAKRVNDMPHAGVVIDSISVDAGGKTIIKLYARDRVALVQFGEAMSADPIFLYTDVSPLAARPGGELYDLDITAFVDYAKLPDVPTRPVP
jgi:hypothetical protein